MKIFYSFLILLFFFGCKEKKSISESKIEIPKEIKDEKFYNALRQSINIAENNNIDPITISPIFTANNLYIYISESTNDCSFGNYYSLPLTINKKYYTIDFIINEFLTNHIDTVNLNFTPLKMDIEFFCHEFSGYAFRYQKNEVGNYQLRKLAHFYDTDYDFVLKEDKQYFPILYEPEEPVDEFK